MSGVAVVRYIMSNYSALTAVVSASNIKAGAIPINTDLPAISVQEVSAVRMKPTTGSLVTERVQVTVMAKTYPTQKSILALVGDAVTNQRGTVNGVSVDSIMPDIEGPDFEDTEAEIYMQSRDFIVRYYD